MQTTMQPEQGKQATEQGNTLAQTTKTFSSTIDRQLLFQQKAWASLQSSILPDHPDHEKPLYLAIGTTLQSSITVKSIPTLYHLVTVAVLSEGQQHKVMPCYRAQC